MPLELPINCLNDGVRLTFWACTVKATVGGAGISLHPVYTVKILCRNIKNSRRYYEFTHKRFFMADPVLLLYNISCKGY